jgi:phosphomannomutase
MSSLMVSISGIRGIIGESLTPEIIVKFTSAYSEFIKQGKIITEELQEFQVRW